MCQKRSQKWTQTDTEVILNPTHPSPIMQLFLSHMKGMAKIRLFHFGAMALILPNQKISSILFLWFSVNCLSFLSVCLFFLYVCFFCICLSFVSVCHFCLSHMSVFCVSQSIFCVCLSFLPRFLFVFFACSSFFCLSVCLLV